MEESARFEIEPIYDGFREEQDDDVKKTLEYDKYRTSKERDILV